MEEAKLITESIGEKSFQGTNGWLQKWKRRHNIARMKIAGKEGDVSSDTVDSWQERVLELIQGYASEDAPSRKNPYWKKESVATVEKSPYNESGSRLCEIMQQWKRKPSFNRQK